MASGKLPTWRCWPAGAIFHPFGSNVIPPPRVPGQVGGISPYVVKGRVPRRPRTQTVVTNDRPRISCFLVSRGLLADGRLLARRIRVERDAGVTPSFTTSSNS
jgi:hypothetical protein